jgi:chemotaxis methyl-accepting protein methylase
VLSDSQLASALLNVVLLGVTEFYRDKPVFDCLRERVLPELSTRDRVLRIWSAACSDGQELVSVVTLLADQGLLTRCQLLGSDCRPDAIRRARSGVFPVQAARGLSPSLSPYLIPHASTVKVVDPLAKALSWKVADLLQGPEVGPWDLILWRNMAIYLRPEVVENIWVSMVRELQPGGFLVCGKADHLPLHPEMLKISPSVYQKRRKPQT